jgi:hypothetical protein
VNEWYCFNTIPVISWQEQVTFRWHDDAPFVLDQHAKLDFYSVTSLKHFTCRCRSTLNFVPTSLFLLIDAVVDVALLLTLCQPVCSYSLMLWGEATNINYIFFGLTQLRLKCTINCTSGRRAIYYINDTVQESWVVTQRMPLVEQELPTLLKEFTPRGLCCSLFSFMCNVL